MRVGALGLTLLLSACLGVAMDRGTGRAVTSTYKSESGKTPSSLAMISAQVLSGNVTSFPSHPDRRASRFAALQQSSHVGVVTPPQ